MLKYNSKGRVGLTLIELLVVIAVISILAGMLLIGLRSARERGQMILCQTHIRSMGNMVQIYNSDNRDLYPSWIDPNTNYNSNPDLWNHYSYQVFSTFENAKWLEYTSLPANADIMYCPANQWHPEAYSELPAPDYVLSSSVFIQPRYLSSNLDFTTYSRSLGGQVQRASTTRFPSSKAGIFELFVWHGWRGFFELGLPVGDLAYWESRLPGSVWFIDGHVGQYYERQATRPMNRYPVWAPMTFGTTEGGLHGRDIE